MDHEEVLTAIQEWRKAYQDEAAARALRIEAEHKLRDAYKVEQGASEVESVKRRRMETVIGIPEGED